MARRTVSECAPRRWSKEQYPFSDDPANGMVDTWCGDRRLWSRTRDFLNPKLATCSKCSAALGKDKLKRLGDRVRLERMDKPVNDYQRSSYRLVIDDEPRGYVSIGNGWGQTWTLFRLKGPDEAYSSYDNGPVVSGKHPSYAARAWTKDSLEVFWPVHRHSKEAMAVAGVALCDRGGLPTVKDMEAERAERDEKARLEGLEREVVREEAAKRRAKQEALRVERLSVGRMALDSLEGRADLTNVERAGLEAIKALLLV